MAFPTGYFMRVSLGGAVSFDKWSINFWVQSEGQNGVPSAADMNTLATAIATAFNTDVWSASTAGLKVSNAPATAFSSCQLSLYQDGAVVQSGVGAITAVVGTNSGGASPTQAWCITLLTALAGRQNRGRVYLPITGNVGATNSLLVSINQANTLANLKAFMEGALFGSMDAMPGVTDSYPVVLSQAGSHANVVTALRVDNIFDSQRGRKNKFVSTQTTSVDVVAP